MSRTDAQWQPIETAEKDRQADRILIFRAGKVSIGWWDDDRYSKSPRPYWGGHDANHWGKTWARSTAPTHWMPLPAPPRDEQPGEGE